MLVVSLLAIPPLLAAPLTCVLPDQVSVQSVESYAEGAPHELREPQEDVEQFVLVAQHLPLPVLALLWLLVPSALEVRFVAYRRPLLLWQLRVAALTSLPVQCEFRLPLHILLVVVLTRLPLLVSQPLAPWGAETVAS